MCVAWVPGNLCVILTNVARYFGYMHRQSHVQSKLTGPCVGPRHQNGARKVSRGWFLLGKGSTTTCNTSSEPRWQPRTGLGERPISTLIIHFLSWLVGLATFFSGCLVLKRGLSVRHKSNRLPLVLGAPFQNESTGIFTGLISDSNPLNTSSSHSPSPCSTRRASSRFPILCPC